MITAKKVIVIMDFDPVFANVFALIQEIGNSFIDDLGNKSLVVYRSDEIKLGGRIIEKLNKLMDDADYFIADISSFNSNVFYEIGYMNGQGKQGLIIHRGALPKASKMKKTPIYISAEDIVIYKQGIYIVDLEEIIKNVLSQLINNSYRKSPDP